VAKGVRRPPGPPAAKRQVAIALGHEQTGPGAPKIVAKGHGEVAEKILRLAFENDVKVRSDPELAQVLSAVEVDCEIPLEAFAAVAEILSYVYIANRRLMNETDDEAEEDTE
jgi:flagellar biosynthesis protein